MNSTLSDSMFKFVPLTYGYVNAKVSALKSYLIHERLYDQIIAARDVGEIVAMLKTTKYAEYIDECSKKYSGIELIEISTMRRLGYITRRITSVLPKSDHTFFSIIVAKWEIFNLKSLISAKIASKSWDDVEPRLIPIHGDMFDDYKEIFNSNDIVSAIRYTEIGEKAFKVAKSTFNISRFGLNIEDPFLKTYVILDNYYQYLLYNVSKTRTNRICYFVDLVKLQLDIKNISISMRAKELGFSWQKTMSQLYPSGNISYAMLERAFNSSFSNILSKFGASSNDAYKAEVEMELFLAKKKKALFRKSVLSLSRVLIFLLMLEEEINNLRKIAIAKDMGLSENEIRKVIII